MPISPPSPERIERFRSDLEALAGDAQSNCKRQAETAYETAKAQAKAQLDAARAGTSVSGTYDTGATGGATDATGGTG